MYLIALMSDRVCVDMILLKHSFEFAVIVTTTILTLLHVSGRGGWGGAKLARSNAIGLKVWNK